jgi:probable F420-dependent oxidoreductase
MHFGGAMFFTDYSMSAPELARALEERGFESVWAPEHSHIPLSRKTPFPGGGDLPKPYYDAMDPFVVLAAAAQATRKIKIGTGVVLIQQRDAIQTAKLVASIDQVSQGRFLLGVGGGWNQDEMEDHGTVYATRFKRVRESIEAMKEVWTKEKAEYHGEFVNFDPMIARPKPVQKPHPPSMSEALSRRRTARDPLWRWLDSRWRYPRGPAEIPGHGEGGWPRSGFDRDHLVRARRGSRPGEAPQ